MEFPDYLKGDPLSPVYHPNIKKCHDVSGWLKYISKDGEFVDMTGKFNILDYEVGKRQKAYQDHKFTEDWIRRKNYKEVVFPVLLKTTTGREYRMNAPDASVKQRHWWIVAPPNSGKTRWLQDTFDGQRVYVPSKGEYPFERYDGQSIVVYDDRDSITFEEFSNVTGVYKIETHVYGKARFVNVFWPEHQARNVIVLSNKTIEQQCGDDSYRMKKRFIQISGAALCPPHDSSDDEDEVADCPPDEHGFAS
ncbi:replication associated protein [Chamois faeces associated circular DNA virus 1]|uniref:replication associated protein n=1 Tax=Chamois faeces associated circular DNA virus 1 TaxID=1843766 RepID=UPI0007C19C00|nr:replication associated protein [Chamois faeces associated circular DNA virus 1]ANC51560.1 replication associated protein [Chamois faeces associated circular DNA virus 1]